MDRMESWALVVGLALDRWRNTLSMQQEGGQEGQSKGVKPQVGDRKGRVSFPVHLYFLCKVGGKVI